MLHKLALQIKYVFHPESLIMGWVSGFAISFMSAIQNVDWTRFFAPGWFSVTLLALMTGEIITCYYTRSPQKRKDFSWEERIRTKLLIASLGVVSLILDSIIVVIIYWLPFVEGSHFPIWGAGFLPITLSTLLWLNTAEAVRMVTNIAHSTGDESIPPVVLWVIRQLRRIDAARMPEGAEPQKRLLDNVTEEDIRLLLDRMSDRKMLDPPPPPLGEGDNPKDDPPKKEKE